jgi:hypothetical protein
MDLNFEARTRRIHLFTQKDIDVYRNDSFIESAACRAAGGMGRLEEQERTLFAPAPTPDLKGRTTAALW